MKLFKMDHFDNTYLGYISAERLSLVWCDCDIHSPHLLCLKLLLSAYKWVFGNSAKYLNPLSARFRLQVII